MNLLYNPNSCYIISVALQIAGALILMVSFWGNTRKRIIDIYFPKTDNTIEDRENILIHKKDVQSIASGVYLNRVAFVYIAMGYLLGIYAKLESINKSCIVAKVICWTIGLIVLGNVVANCTAKMVFRKSITVNYEDVKDRVTESVTDADIDALFDEIFKK